MSKNNNEQRELEQLRIRCANLEKSYRESYPDTVRMAREPLEKELEELRRDRARLEWLFENSEGTRKDVAMLAYPNFTTTPREAIDNAAGFDWSGK